MQKPARSFPRLSSVSCVPVTALLLLLLPVRHVGEDGSINWGSCMFGQLDGSKGTGLDIAALSDKNSDYVGEQQRR